ncbi:E3 ubiquitin-protein ligase RNF128 isoform X1 [Spea bombifrons]|uniref:E3 ubiquitin-protein ligase RNF128 isoform X1 n=1 Tax=Spea bombifrons TaxID=233779 RepID=UPI00234BD82A|nr:E3 ubiquitin-protein ligase RNF128 isoform X1 [Spea bombifrons]
MTGVMTFGPQIPGSRLLPSPPRVIMLLLLLLFAAGAQEARAEVFWTANLNYSYVLENRTFSEFGEFGIFGHDSPVDRAVGLLVLPKRERRHEDRYTACDKRVNFTVPASWSGPWIALIERGGGCTFTEKINAAAASGAEAVIIYNDNRANNNEVIEMSHAGTKDTIAIMISNEKGMEILQLVTQGIQVTMVIEVGKKHGTWINHYSIFFVSVSFFVVTAATVGYFIFYSARRWRVTRAQNKRQKKLQDEAKKAINQLQLRTIKQGDKVLGPDGDSCAVCIDTYKPNDVVRILTCNHFFHKNCIDPWLLEHRTCPMCKCDILKSLGIAADEEEQDTNAAIASVSSELQRNSTHVEDETRSDNASSGYASVRGAEEPAEDTGVVYDEIDLVNNEVHATAIEVLPQLDNPTFESEESYVREMKS